ncbi:conserved hypothetical protein [Catenulispora acidiphila DSM 44928]|uniref:DUF2797 domain-containing protein n=1 Tax=Catenulispora acidiphila (strain DSM 44928 / JCM 14897 / NBRC 102108 / NRRL B-24433 / ID139908) TaxID=479433 RepID=C7Q1F4_CATAD|nr:conserved hypothetical protein [Catenulispora acidiphila DSM 44928]
MALGQHASVTMVGVEANPNSVSVPAPSPAPDRLCIGLSWFEEKPALTSVEGGDLRLKALSPGARLALSWSGRRRCIGWTAPGTGRTPCADNAEIDGAATLAQCPACQNRDHGLAIARDRITDDGRSYQLYLAWFAPGMLKVGITGVQRGVARLLEQGAIGYTVIATGTLPAARRAEITVSASGLAKERYRSRAKVEAWWGLPETDGLRSALTEGRAKALRMLADHTLEAFPDGPLVDNTAFFGLGDGAPATYREVEALDDSGSLAGEVRAVIGKHVFVDGDADVGVGVSTPLLLNTQLLAGRHTVPTPDATAGANAVGVRTVERRRPLLYDTPTLF